MVRSCLLVTLITCLKGHKSLRVLYGRVFQQWLSVSYSVSQSVSDKGPYRAVRGQLKTAQKKLYNILGSLLKSLQFHNPYIPNQIPTDPIKTVEILIVRILNVGILKTSQHIVFLLKSGTCQHQIG